jgi:hypothetical protein
MLEIFGVLLVMAVDTQILPVAPVRRVVGMVVVLVVNGQLVEISLGEFPAASRTDPGVNPQ